MFFAAREDAKRWVEARHQRKQERQDNFRKEGYRKGLEEGRAEGRRQERERFIKLLAKNGVTLTPEIVIGIYKDAD